MTNYGIGLGRILIVLLLVATVHWFDRFAPAYFVAIGAAALFMLWEQVSPGGRWLERFGSRERLAVWLVIVALGVIGAVHNANHWSVDGRLMRPTDVGLWKTELVLIIAVTAPVIHTIAGLFVPGVAPVDGRTFANEFALYVNFSGIALVLWTGEAVLSGATLGAVAALMLLAELTLHAGA